jgi:arylsulfatase A-like enzyme
LWRNGEEIWEDGQFFPDLMVRETDEFISQNKEKPFFIYWAINVPHYPLQGTDGWRTFYEHLPEPRKMYAAFVSTMDEKIGEVIKSVDRHGLTRDTIIIFQSDHGHSTEVRTFGGGGDAGPYRGAKFSLFEGGIRVPAIISWPGHVKEDLTRNQLATSIDWFPTIADLCDIPLPATSIDGASLTPILQSSDAPGSHATFHWQTGSRNKPQWAVREGNWKLLGNPNDTSNKAPIQNGDNRYLVNLQKDVGEMNNVASDHPDIVKKLSKLHQDWARQWK